MGWPVSALMVSIVFAGPPAENAALILLVPYPGIFTYRSRGKDSIEMKPLSPSIRSRMSESDRPGSPAPSAPARLSEPISRMFTGRPGMSGSTAFWASFTSSVSGLALSSVLSSSW